MGVRARVACTSRGLAVLAAACINKKKRSQHVMGRHGPNQPAILNRHSSLMCVCEREGGDMPMWIFLSPCQVFFW